MNLRTFLRSVLYTRSWATSLKGTNNISEFVNIASAATLQFCVHSMKAGVDYRFCAPTTIYRNRQRAGCGLQAIVCPPLS